MHRCSIALITALTGAGLSAASSPGPTFQHLLDPAVFPDAQSGMVVEQVSTPAGLIQVRTTGARIEIDAATGVVRFEQRLGHARPLADLSLGRALSGVRITHHEPGFVRLDVASPRLTVRINGDSLFMLQAHEAVTAQVTKRIATAWFGSAVSGYLLADEWGAFGLTFSETEREDAFDPYAERVLSWPMPTDSVMWIGVCPPKPYPWERSFSDHVVWHWSQTTGYPSDDTLRSWKSQGNIVLLQSEVMLWKDWNLDFEPRLGRAEFERVRETLHRLGMRFIVYTSPYYFLRDTDLEPRALNSFDDFAGWPPGTGTGENMEQFMTAIEHVVRELKPDGLYFDGQYDRNPAALYSLARRTRALLGEDGILEWHSTGAMAGGRCYLPQADAYVDLVLRGEGVGSLYGDSDYLRFFVSGYNIHNTIGVLCNNGPPGLTSDIVRDVLNVNGRLHTIASWLPQPELVRILEEEYHPALTATLKEHVDAAVDARQKSAVAKEEKRRLERQRLTDPPQWGPPLKTIDLSSMSPTAESFISPHNKEPFRITAEGFHVRGHANTYAFLKIPLEVVCSGVTVKLRHGTDGGMSWGPAIALQWSEGTVIRLGTRSEGKLQADVLGTQHYGFAHDPTDWIWLRCRWYERLGLVESSRDGITFAPLWTFQHSGTLNRPTAALLVGKVPYNGQAVDYTDLGPEGECTFKEVRIHGAATE